MKGRELATFFFILASFRGFIEITSTILSISSAAYNFFFEDIFYKWLDMGLLLIALR